MELILSTSPIAYHRIKKHNDFEIQNDIFCYFYDFIGLVLCNRDIRA